MAIYVIWLVVDNHGDGDPRLFVKLQHPLRTILVRRDHRAHSILERCVFSLDLKVPSLWALRRWFSWVEIIRQDDGFWWH